MTLEGKKPILADLGPVKIDHTRGSAPQIVDILRPAILRVDLPPGCRISETEVGSLFGVSRTPVREALALLLEEGLVVTWPSRGNYVSKLSKKRILESQYLREALETMNVTRLCDTGLSDYHENELRDCLRLQAQAQMSGDKSTFHDQDDRFHSILARATGFERADLVLTREKVALDRLRYLSLERPPHLEQLISEHVEILEAIVARDVSRATAAIQAHLRSILGALSRVVVDNREYFE